MVKKDILARSPSSDSLKICFLLTWKHRGIGNTRSMKSYCFSKILIVNFIYNIYWCRENPEIYLCSACLSIPVRSQELWTALILSMFSSNCREEFLAMSLTKCKNDISKNLSFISTAFLFWKCDCFLFRCFKIASTGNKCPHNEIRLGWLGLWFELSRAE